MDRLSLFPFSPPPAALMAALSLSLFRAIPLSSSSLRRPFNRHQIITAFSSSSSQSDAYRGPKPQRDLVRDWVSNNDDLVRSFPIYVGGFSLLSVLINRAFSGVAPVADASRAWESLSVASCCRSLVVIYRGNCLLQIGIAAESSDEGSEAAFIDVPKLMQGSLYRSAMESGKQSYLANLSLYPGKSELPFLPLNTQAAILQPLSDKGIAIIGGDTIRGFTNLDQAWITSIAEKLDATLSKT